MKIAVILTGRINHDSDIFENFCNTFLKNYDTDIFISHSIGYTLEEITKYKNLYNPKIMIENDEKYFNINKYQKPGETNAHNVMCMYLNRKNISRLFEQYIFENNIKYDIVISSRCDLFFKSKIELEKLIESNILYIPKGNDYREGINDQMAIGSSDIIIKYLNVYDELYNLLENGIILHPETLLSKYLESQHIHIQRIDIDYFIKR